jgi:hypothetical protein
MDSPEVGSLDGMNPKPYTFRMGGKLCLLLGERSLPLLRSSRCKIFPLLGIFLNTRCFPNKLANVLQVLYVREKWCVVSMILWSWWYGLGGLCEVASGQASIGPCCEVWDVWVD